MNRILKELKKQQRSLAWLSREVGVHYQTTIRWKDNGVPKWHHAKISEVLKKPLKELFE